MKILLASVLVLLLSPSALFAQLYSIEAYTCDGPFETRAQGGEPLHWGGVFNDCEDPQSWVELDGRVGRGSLSAMAHAVDGHVGGSLNFQPITGVHSIMRFPDVIIEGPAGMVSITLNMDLHGFISAESATGQSFSTLQIEIYLDNIYSGGNGSIDAGHNPAGLQDSGMLEGLMETAPGGARIDAIISSSVMQVPTNTPLFLLVALQAQVGAFDPDLTADGFCDARNTLSFPRDMPVFDLPAGYTVTSNSAGIVDNSWTADVPNDKTSWGRLKSRY